FESAACAGMGAANGPHAMVVPATSAVPPRSRRRRFNTRFNMTSSKSSATRRLAQEIRRRQGLHDVSSVGSELEIAEKALAVARHHQADRDALGMVGNVDGD